MSPILSAYYVFIFVFELVVWDSLISAILGQCFVFVFIFIYIFCVFVIGDSSVFPILGDRALSFSYVSYQ